ncbi:hypothetical protein [Micromonospora thermarum]|uniref:HTTM domain-containing protein n=1 Tax=Micromonospora thermarum TaxID=2720024 RepID=A0ABX0Z466_9ACTN|nr:hypothetical protein [Micromonospora thermarum]NJP32597.1 hypothetical protein [Micromonospora thermarum]
MRMYLAMPGPRSIALARVAVAGSLLLVLARHVDTPLLAGRQPPELYRPVGVAMLIGQGMISPTLLHLLLGLAGVTVLAALVGLYARTTFAVGYFSTLILVSVSYSFSVPWSHGENATFLAGLPLLFAPLGDAWSLGPRRTAPAASGARYGVPLRGAQAMLALYFFNAVYWKLKTTGPEWAFSDNLQNIFAIRYLVIGEHPPWVVTLALQQPWIAQAMAASNLIFQATPFIMLPLLRWRGPQLLAAAAFTMEAAGLTAVMGLFGGEMIPLGLIFLSVDRGRTVAAAAVPVPTRAQPVRSSRRLGAVHAVGLIVATCLTVQTTIAWSRYDYFLRSYPFTATAMYSGRYGPITHRLSVEMRPNPPAVFRERVRLLYTGQLTDQALLLRRAKQIDAEHRSLYGRPLDQIVIRTETWDVTGGAAHVVSSTVVLAWRPGEVSHGS